MDIRHTKDVQKKAQVIQQYFNKINVTRIPDLIGSTDNAIYDGFGSYRTNAEGFTTLDQSRIQRYREYSQMCYVPELNAGVEIYCVSGDTKIATDTGYITIKELAESDKKEFYVFAYDFNEHRIVVTKAKNARKTGRLKTLKITFDDGKYLIVTHNHKILLRNEEYIEAKSLKVGDSLMAQTEEVFEIEVAKIEEWDEMDVYDITTPKYHNFATDSIIIHNSDDGSLYNEDEKVIKDEADNQDVAESLNNLWFKSLDMNSLLWHILYETCKYGDSFYELIPDSYKNPKRIKFMKFIPPQYISRNEKDGNLISFSVRIPPVENASASTPQWAGNVGDGEEITLKPWQIAHFKLEDNEFDPYGKSVLESGRLAFKQMKLIEDAMLIYRISRAPERRVFRIPVGQLPYREAMQRVEDIKQRYRKTPWVDSMTGEVNYKANPMCITFDTKIDLLDGRAVELKQLIEEYESGKENWVYSIDREDGNKIVPGRIEWAGKTRKSAELVEVLIDNGKSIRCTPDHKFLLRNGEYKEAKDLESGDSLMPLYRKLTDKKNSNKSTGYELVYDPKSNIYRYTHRLVAESIWPELKKSDICHHINYLKTNNSPFNLLKCTRSEHRAIHNNETKDYTKLIGEKNGRWKNISFKDIKTWSIKNAKTFGDIEEHFKCSSRIINSRLKRAGISKKEFSEKMMLPNKFRFSNYGKKCKVVKEELIELIKKSNIKSSKELSSCIGVSFPTVKKHLRVDSVAKFINSIRVPSSKVVDGYFNGYTMCELAEKHDCSYTMIRNILVKSDKEKYQPVLNHKVVSVTHLNKREDTGCITINKYHNFATNGIIIRNSINDDFFLPVRQDGTGITIDHLPGGAQLGEIDDVRYFKEKILHCMRIPIAYLTGEMSGDVARTSLASLDVRFAKTIERIQKMIIRGLTKIAVVELAFKRFSIEDMLAFQIILTPPSKIYELQELESVTAELNVVQAALQLADESGNLYLPKEWLYKRISKFNEQEISDIKLMQQAEAGEKAEAAQRAEAAAAGPELAGGGATPGEAAGAGLVPSAGLGPEELGVGEMPGIEGGEEVPTAATSGGESELELASKILKIGSDQFLLENEGDIKELIKFVKEQKEIKRDAKDKSKKKITRMYENNFEVLFTEGEFKGLITRKKNKTKMLRG